MAEQGTFNSFLTLPGPHPSSSAQTWELHKPLIRELYVRETQTLEHVMKVMKEKYAFVASKKVYRKRLAKWGFERKMKGTGREAILRKWMERGATDKQSSFTLRGGKVPLWHFSEYSKRSRKTIQKMASQESSGAATPPHLRCSTPEPDTWQANCSAHFLQRFAEDIEAYKLARSIGVGPLTDASQLQDNYLRESVADHGENGDPTM